MLLCCRREAGLKHRETMFQSEVAEYERGVKETRLEKSKMAAELEELNEKIATFHKDETTSHSFSSSAY